uniref:Ribosome-recycling factor, mitochondrial n=1 Tax=Romanomermis culicivorax TaxID=13658 RepID=A0A915INB2_ROMCU
MNRDVDYCDELLDMQAFKNDLQHELNRYKQEILDQLSLRVNLNAYENLMIKLPDEQGSVPLNHIAKVSLKNPQMLMINATMSPDKVALITGALSKSALNVNPQADGAMIHVPLPRVTRQHRESLVKNAKNLYNQCFERLRRVRKHHHDGFAKKEDSVSKDELVKTIKVLDETVKEYARIAEDMMKQKQKELMNENL